MADAIKIILFFTKDNPKALFYTTGAASGQKYPSNPLTNQSMGDKFSVGIPVAKFIPAKKGGFI
jgi:hypothetical protein